MNKLNVFKKFTVILQMITSTRIVSLSSLNNFIIDFVSKTSSKTIFVTVIFLKKAKHRVTKLMIS